MLRLLGVVVLLIVMSGCVTRQVGLTYSGPPESATTSADHHQSVVIRTVVDRRPDGPYWLGAIRGGYGNPLKTLETEPPVKDLVAKALEDALTARSLLATADDQAMLLTLTIYRLDCNQYIRREAHADFEITLTNHRTGVPIYTDRVTSDNVSGSIFAFDVGVFASTDRLRQVASDTMNDAINKALDKPAFLIAVTGSAH